MEKIDPRPLSAFDIDIVRGAFRSSVAEGLVGESRWNQHIKDLFKELTGYTDVDADIIQWIVRKEPANGQI
ncbi:hypothetical protein ACFX5Q_32455 [Mesorhizobium sp. IMUNJ 23033]|uniref:hypothetical protein n=1 Tax=Mesorhizobium sp. IMUNJ 23033 TaxID=3378039 RepID=UPI00384FD130